MDSKKAWYSSLSFFRALESLLDMTSVWCLLSKILDLTLLSLVGGCGDRELLWRGTRDCARAGSARCSCGSRLSQPAQSKRRVGSRRIRRVLARNINTLTFHQQKIIESIFSCSAQTLKFALERKKCTNFRKNTK